MTQLYSTCLDSTQLESRILMEVVKEIRVSRDNMTMDFGQSGFTARLPGLKDTLGAKLHAIKLKSLRMPYVWRKVVFDAYYGKGNPSGKLVNYTLYYRSIDDLCNQLSVTVNYSIDYQESKLSDEKGQSHCNNRNREHTQHMCNNVGGIKKVLFVVKNNRVLIECAKSTVLFLSENLANILGFCTGNPSIIESTVADNKYIQFIAGCMFGTTVKWLENHETVCHVALENLNSRMICLYGHFPVLFSYDYCTAQCDNIDSFKLFSCVSDCLTFHFYNEKMQPFDFGSELKSVVFSFTLQFLNF